MCNPGLPLIARVQESGLKLFFKLEFQNSPGDSNVSGVMTINKPGRFLIGRSEEAQIRFANDNSCSRKAAFLDATESGLFLDPIAGASPSSVNGAVVSQRTELRSGDVIGMGNQRFRIAELSAASSAAPRPAPQPGQAPAMGGGEKTTIMTSADLASAASGAGPSRIDIGETSTMIGRASQSGMVTLNHPAVSRVHAELRRRDGTAFIRDRGSVNGTFVNGKRLSGATALKEGDTVSIGPYAFHYSKSALLTVQFDENAPVLEAVGLTVDVKDRQSGKPMRILDDVNLQVKKGEFVCIVGSSGSGKSTLVNLLSARTELTKGIQGVVKMKGADLRANFASLKNKMAYVPQNNALHETLSLRQALGFAAKLRLQPDLTAKDRARVVESAAKAVDLSQHLFKKISILSGGQKKRASLASEMLASPEVLFLDEVTSGLDEATDREIMSLMRKRADAGMTIVCVTHTLANIQAFCDKLVVMGNGGIPTFIGSPREALQFFNVETLGDIFDCLAETGPEPWRQRAAQMLPSFRSTGKAAASSAQAPAAVMPAAPMNYTGILRQLGILTHRSTLLTLADTKFLLMAFVQSIMIGAMLGYAYSEFGDAGEEISSRIALLMALGTSALWLGTNTAASNIVGEALIFQRERDVNVSTIAFVLSKFLVSGVFSVIQVSLVLFLAAALAEDLPGNDFIQWCFMAIGALIGVGIGLSISAFSNTQEQANTIVPLALIPQLILAGVLVPALPEPGVWFSKVSISAFWMTEGMTDVYIRYADTAPSQINVATGRPEELEAESAYTAFVVLFLHLGGCLTGAVGLALNRFNRR